MSINFGKNIKQLRVDNKLTQEKLGDLFGVSFQTVSKWERGDTYPDIAMLIQISKYFNISVDDLLGVNECVNDEKISEYLEMYDNLRLKDRKTVFLEYQNAVMEFPNDFRILVRYMELLREERAHITLEQWENKDFSEFDKVECEIVRIYNKIQNSCTDDSIRIWSKHLMCEQLFYRYQCCGYDEKYRKQALDILNTLPAMCDSKEYLSMMDTDEDNIEKVRENAIQELLFLLQNTLLIYCISRLDDKFSIDFKINLIEHINELFRIFDSDENSKNRMHLIYNYGRLGYLYFGVGNKDKALYNFRIAIEAAKRYDETPNAEYVYRFYEKEGIFHNMNMQNRLKELLTKHYQLSEEFKESKDFQDILAMIDE